MCYWTPKAASRSVSAPFVLVLPSTRFDCSHLISGFWFLREAHRSEVQASNYGRHTILDGP